MAKYNIGLIGKINQSLIKNGIDADIRKKIMKSGELVNGKTKPEKVAEWCFNCMNVMDELLDENTKQKVREECACCLGGKRDKLCKEVNKKFATPEERIKAINDTHFIFGHEIKITGKGRYEVKFFDDMTLEKRCSCMGGRLSALGKKWSKTWCYCCGGHVKHHLETILGKEVEVKIITSALMSQGKKSCHFELREV